MTTVLESAEVVSKLLTFLENTLSRESGMLAKTDCVVWQSVHLGSE